MTQTAEDRVSGRPVGEKDMDIMEPCLATLTGLAQRPKQGSTPTLAAAVLPPIFPPQTYQIPGSQDQLRDSGRGGTSGRLQVVITSSVINASHLEISNSKAMIHRDSFLDYLSPHKPEYGLPELLWLASL